MQGKFCPVLCLCNLYAWVPSEFVMVLSIQSLNCAETKCVLNKNKLLFFIEKDYNFIRKFTWLNLRRREINNGKCLAWCSDFQFTMQFCLNISKGKWICIRTFIIGRSRGPFYNNITYCSHQYYCAKVYQISDFVIVYISYVNKIWIQQNVNLKSSRVSEIVMKWWRRFLNIFKF